MYRLNSENGGFTPDKSRGPKAPRDLSGVKPTLEYIIRYFRRSSTLSTISDVRVHYPLFPTFEYIIRYFRRSSTLSTISAGTIFKSRRQILKHTIVLDRFIRQINTEKNKENRLDRVLMLYIATVGLNICLCTCIF